MLNLISFVCGLSLSTTLFIVDGVILLSAGSLILWYYLKNKNQTGVESETVSTDEPKDNDQSAVKQDVDNQSQPANINQDNNVEHFSNQITNISEEMNNELNANVQSVKPSSNSVNIQASASQVVYVGRPKEKNDSVSVNHGTDAYKNSTEFFNVIKSEQNQTKQKKTRKKS